MSDDVSDIKALYDRDLPGEHTRLDRHQLEHDITWAYLDRHLPAKGAILEIGAATGRYTVELAKRGYRITVVDLSDKAMETCMKHLSAEGLSGQVDVAVADARDLSEVKGSEFDAVLVMGPFYHLVFAEDRLAALTQAFDRLKPGGVLLSSWISRLGILGDLLKQVPDWIERQNEVRSVMEHGRDPEDLPRGGFRGYFATTGEIPPFHEQIGLKTVCLAASEPAISADDESYNRLEGKRRQLWLDLLYEVSTDKSIVAASRHLLYIGTKPG